MPMKFEYDPKGDIFTYYMCSFGALVLVPVTIYKWSSSGISKEQIRLNKLRDRHGNSKWFAAKEKKIRQESRTPWVRRLLIVLGWALIGLAWYHASNQFDPDSTKPEFDPFEILGLSDRRDELSDFDTSKRKIKKQYKMLSLTDHPDKKIATYIKEHEGVEPPDDARKEIDDAWALIVKAHETLTDELSYENWLKYGNPDGQLTTKFGIALPSWLVEEKNSFYVLGVYGLVFGIMLPAMVGSWWYRSIQYTGDSVLIKTTKMFEFYLYKTPLMNRRRALMVFSGAFEFKRENNKEIKDRESDSEELPKLMKEIEEHERNIAKPPTDQPFSFPYSMKVRLLYFAHLYNIKLTPELEEDLAIILKKVPILHGELISKCFFLTQFMLQNGHFQRVPKVESLDNIIKNMQNLTQGLGLNQRSVAFNQLPHFREEFIKYLNNKKARSLRQLAAKPTKEIREIFKSVSNDVIMSHSDESF
jgi:translocation protein SEC63